MFLFAVPAVPPCSPGDFFEPNDTDSAAAEVAELLFTALGACPTDEDWFSIELAAGDDLLVDAFFGSVEGNIDIEIVDPTGAVVASGSNTGDGESASHTAASDGTYLIRVFLESDAGGDPGVAYEIELIIS